MTPSRFYNLLMARSKLALLEAFKSIEKKRDWDHGYRHAVRGKGRDPFDHRDPECRDDDRCYDVGYGSGRARKTGKRGPVHFGPKKGKEKRRRPERPKPKPEPVELKPKGVEPRPEPEKIQPDVGAVAKPLPNFVDTYYAGAEVNYDLLGDALGLPKEEVDRIRHIGVPLSSNPTDRNIKANAGTIASYLDEFVGKLPSFQATVSEKDLEPPPDPERKWGTLSGKKRTMTEVANRRIREAVEKSPSIVNYVHHETMKQWAAHTKDSTSKVLNHMGVECIARDLTVMWTDPANKAVGQASWEGDIFVDTDASKGLAALMQDGEGRLGEPLSDEEKCDNWEWHSPSEVESLCPKQKDQNDAAWGASVLFHETLHATIVSKDYEGGKARADRDQSSWRPYDMTPTALKELQKKHQREVYQSEPGRVIEEAVVTMMQHDADLIGEWARNMGFHPKNVELIQDHARRRTSGALSTNYKREVGVVKDLLSLTDIDHRELFKAIRKDAVDTVGILTTAIVKTAKDIPAAYKLAQMKKTERGEFDVVMDTDQIFSHSTFGSEEEAQAEVERLNRLEMHHNLWHEVSDSLKEKRLCLACPGLQSLSSGASSGASDTHPSHEEQQLYASKRKISALKSYRKRLGVDLPTAKEALEKWWTTPNDEEQDFWKAGKKGIAGSRYRSRVGVDDTHAVQAAFDNWWNAPSKHEQNLMLSNKKIAAIRAYRGRTGSNLRSAKETLEKWHIDQGR